MGLFSTFFSEDEDKKSLLGTIGDRTTQFLKGSHEEREVVDLSQTQKNQQLMAQARKPLEPEYEALAQELVGILKDKLDLSELSEEERTRVVMIGVQMYAEKGLDGMKLLEDRVLALMGPVWIVQDAWRSMRQSDAADANI